jgi:L-amino acid N-acyltransferase YncA
MMVAGIEASNGASLALHRSEGFAESCRIAEVGCKFGRWLDLVLLSRKLDNRAGPGHALYATAGASSDSRAAG